jgi:peptidoglycan-N-acetylglucosamine deacetylase
VSSIVSSVVTNEPLVALTFDDGPHPTFTPMILDVLDDLDVPATFFLLGTYINADTVPIVRRIHEAGHEIGNHGYSHTSFDGMPEAHISEELRRTHALLQPISGPPNVIRPPFGHASDRANAVATAMGYRATVLWSAWAVDWSRPQPPADVLVHRILNGHEEYTGIGRGGVVLLHDGWPPTEPLHKSRAQTVEAVGKLVPRLRDAGFGFLTVSELLDVSDTRVPAASPVERVSWRSRAWAFLAGARAKSDRRK